MADAIILIAKPGTWFDAGAECTVIADCVPGGVLVVGMRDGKLDEELCSLDEFETQG